MSHMRSLLRVLLLGFIVCLASGLLRAQFGTPMPTSVNPGTLPTWTSLETNRLNKDLNHGRRYFVVAGKVMSLDRQSISGADVQVSPALPSGFRTFKTNAMGDFETVYNLKVAYANDSRVWITVKKKGYQTAHVLIDYAEVEKPTRFTFTLRPEHPDPDLLPQQTLLADLLPRLKSLSPADGLEAKSRKKYAKAVQEFVDKGRPDSALSGLSEVARSNPECAKCLTMLALAELDSGDWDGAARRVDAAIKLTAKDDKAKGKTGGSLEAVMLAGVMRSWMHMPQSAAQFFAYVIRREPKNQLALQEIGRAYWLLHAYPQAAAYLRSSVKAGGGQESYLLWIQALLKEHDADQADKQMKHFLHGRKVKKMPLEVRRVWAEVQNGKKVEALYAKTHHGKKMKRGRRKIVAIDYLHDSLQKIHLKGLEPAKNQDDLKGILAAVGKNVAALFHDFQNSTSLEKVHQQQLSRSGKVAQEAVEKFRYLCLLPSNPEVPGFTEYRKGIHREWGTASGVKHGYMLTSGFVSASLIFYPAFQSGSEFRYLGRQKVDGHETDVVAFAQIPAKADLVGSFTVGKHTAPTFQQGLAWIDTQNHQIVRLRTDLLKPLPEVRLDEERTQIDYQRVSFKKLNQALWLPKNVTVTVAWNGRTLRNEHQYSGFKLFNVHAAEKIQKRIRAKKMAERQSHHH